MYRDITRYVLGLAAGLIVLLVGSLNFNLSNAGSLRPFASPLFLVAMTISHILPMVNRCFRSKPSTLGSSHKTKSYALPTITGTVSSFGFASIRTLPKKFPAAAAPRRRIPEAYPLFGNR